MVLSVGGNRFVSPLFMVEDVAKSAPIDRLAASLADVEVLGFVFRLGL